MDDYVRAGERLTQLLRITHVALAVLQLAPPVREGIERRRAMPTILEIRGSVSSRGSRRQESEATPAGEFREDVTKTRKDGSKGKLRIDYGESRASGTTEPAVKRLGKFVDGAKTAGDL